MTTQSEPQTFDQILEQTFPKDIQQKRIRKGNHFSYHFPSLQLLLFLFLPFTILELISLNDLDQNFYKINLQTSALGLKVVVFFHLYHHHLHLF